MQLCPRCDGQGYLHKIRINNQLELYLCDEWRCLLGNEAEASVIDFFRFYYIFEVEKS